MKRYRATASVTIGQGEVLGLDEQQFKTRAHRVDVIKKPAKEGARWQVRAKQPLQFKAGETIMLADRPKHIAALLNPVDTAAPADQLA